MSVEGDLIACELEIEKDVAFRRKLWRVWLDHAPRLEPEERDFLRENIVVRVVKLSEEQEIYADGIGKKYVANW